MKKRERVATLALLVIGVVGLAVRFWLANVSIGCDDADIWKEHADLIAAHGVGYAYEHPQPESLQFNHPPLMGYLSTWARHASGSDMVRFAFWMKLLGLLTEVMAAVLIFKIWSRRNVLAAAGAFAAYATCPTLIAIAGYHGNTDCAYAGLVLLSFYLMCEKRSPALSGLALAAALNVKILPLLMIPPLLSQCRSWRQALRFSLAASTAIIPLLPFLLTIPDAVYHKMIAYNSQQLEWGLYTFLKYANEEEMLGGAFKTITGDFVRLGRYVIVTGIVGLSVLAAFRPLRFGYRVGAAAWALFLVLTPGFGVQYVVAVLPLLFAVDLRPAVLYGVLAGAMLVFVYGVRLKLVLPLHGLVQYYPLPKLAVVFGVLAWAVLVVYLVTTLKRLAVTRY